MEVEIVGDASSLRRAVGQADSSTQKLGSSFGRLAKGGALAAGAAGVGALIYTIKTGIGEFAQSQKVTAQTNAVIKSTGKAAHVSAKQVDALATSLMKKSGVDDEVIKSGENMLLTFTNIRNEAGKGNKIFDQATKATLDLSVATGKDMAGASVLVGKALNDPIKGLTALTRVGVSFSDSQKKSIKSMVEHGKTAQAQKVILKELNKEFGGSAEAAGKTLPGQLNILKERFNNFSGDLVAKTIPILQKAIGWLRDHWPEIRAKFLEMWAAIKPTLTNLGDLVVTIVGLIRKHWGTIGPILQIVVDRIKIALKTIADIIKLFTAILRGDWGAAWDALKAIVRDVLNNIVNLLKLFKATLLAAAVALGKAILHGIEDGLDAAWKGLKTALSDLFHKAIEWVKDVLGIKSPSSVFHDIGVNMIKGMVGGIGSMGGFLKAAVVKLAKSVPGRLLGAITHGHSRSGGDLGGLSQHVRDALTYAQQRGWHGVVTSGFRTYAEQAALYRRYLAGGPLAAAPGHSSHESGNAVDVTDYQTFGRIMATLPAAVRLYNRLGARDPVHFSVSGYAKGGIFNRPTIGMIGEAGPEAVIPLSRGGGRPMQVNLQLDGRTLAALLLDPLRGQVRQLERAGGTF